MPRRNTPKKRYPDPDCEYDLFDLGALPDPPDDYTLYGYAKENFGSFRIFSSAITKDLIEFHCWGIEPGVEGRSKKETRLMALRKLIYYQADEHRPPTLNDFMDFSRDAGPRLLRTDLDPMPLPVSRFYPTAPPPGTGLFEGGIPRSYVQQFAYPSRSVSNPTVPSQPPPTSVLPGHPTAGRPRTVPDEPSQSTQQPGATITPLRHREMNPRPLPKSSTVPLSTAIPAQLQPPLAVVESVERALLDLKYRLLERHPQAAGNVPQPYLTAASAQDLLRMEPRSFTLTSHVQLARSRDGSDFVLDPQGLIYACRGRGPVSRVNSSAIDCAIVAGKFLNVGSTMIDRASADVAQALTKVEKGFRAMVDTDWAMLSPDRSIATRDAFRDVVVSELGQDFPASDVWDECTRSSGQFHISYTERFAHCSFCLNSYAPEPTPVLTSAVSPTHFESDAHGIVTMEALLNRFFSHQSLQDCIHCDRKDGVLCERTFNGLPLRLVVQPDYSASPRDHTSSNIKIKYVDDRGQEQVATYRWLGGIYCNKAETGPNDSQADPYRYRIYWTDSERGEEETGQLRMYDAAQNLGLIVGAIPAYHQDEPIPEAWCRGVPIPLLFYEQVLNPDRSALEVAQQAVADMLYAVDNDILILQEHQPWTSVNRQRLSEERRSASDTEAVQSSNVTEHHYDASGETSGTSSSLAASEQAVEEDIDMHDTGLSPSVAEQLFHGQIPQDIGMGPILPPLPGSDAQFNTDLTSNPHGVQNVPLALIPPVAVVSGNPQELGHTSFPVMSNIQGSNQQDGLQLMGHDPNDAWASFSEYTMGLFGTNIEQAILEGQEIPTNQSQPLGYEVGLTQFDDLFNDFSDPQTIDPFFLTPGFFLPGETAQEGESSVQLQPSETAALGKRPAGDTNEGATSLHPPPHKRPRPH
jgi:hypothetical protein